MPSFSQFFLLVSVCLATQISAQSFGQSTGAREANLIANVSRLAAAMEFLGRPWDKRLRADLEQAARANQSDRIKEILKSLTLLTITINPESRVKVERGLAKSEIQQSGYIPFLVQIINQGSVKTPLSVRSPQAGLNYDGVTKLSMQRQEQLELLPDPNNSSTEAGFLDVRFMTQPPMSVPPNGTEVEYAILLIYSSVDGKREATLEFQAGPGTQDLGFRAALPILFDIQPAVAVPLRIRDFDGEAAFSKLLIRDGRGFVYPPQSRRTVPDLFFQPHIYREDGENVLLPPGEFVLETSRGPEYHVTSQKIKISANDPAASRIDIGLKRWIHPMDYGYYCGDHHIHGAGCAHYTSPSEGITPRDMFRQVAGEGLNVGCILTWGPCFEHQRNFFKPDIDDMSRPKTIIKYDLEISGFGSQALGHVCLLNLRNQEYPGSNGTKEKGWPTWATPALKWAKAQNAVTGYAHSASGLQLNPNNASARLMKSLDADSSGLINREEAAKGLLPADYAMIDRDGDGFLSRIELEIAIDIAADQLPNLAIPEMDSVGAMELPVSVAAGVCDFISSMDTARIAEWNMWYHILNCGYPLKVSGETDFPCMSGTAVGQGRTYAFLGDVDHVRFQNWCDALAAGRSYVSDGYAHAFETKVHTASSSVEVGDTLQLPQPATIKLTAKVAFAPRTPETVAQGTRLVEGKRRFSGDTVTLHGTTLGRWVEGGKRRVDVVVNGNVVASQEVVADGQLHDLIFEIPIERSSWVALRCFPSLHTNPIDVQIANKPIRASAASARWCEETIHQLWSKRENNIRNEERDDAKREFQKAIEAFRLRGKESSP